MLQKTVLMKMYSASNMAYSVNYAERICVDNSRVDKRSLVLVMCSVSIVGVPVNKRGEDGRKQLSRE